MFIAIITNKQTIIKNKQNKTINIELTKLHHIITKCPIIQKYVSQKPNYIGRVYKYCNK